MSGIILNNEYMSEILKEYLGQSLSPYFLTHTLIPKIRRRLHEAISGKLKSAVSICLITDIWTNTIHNDFKAIGGTLTDSNLVKSIIVLDMC